MKNLSELEKGARFIYGGIEWVKLETIGPGALCLAAESVFERAFDDDNKNDWRVSSLRRELNGPFFDALIREGADPEAFLPITSDLTADDGMTDYGDATDKIALISCHLYRCFRALIPQIGQWWWTLTAWTCDPEYSYYVRIVNSSGALDSINAYGGSRVVRPLCYLKSEILVFIPGEENEGLTEANNRLDKCLEAADAITSALEDYPVDIWGDALGSVISSLLDARCNALEIALEEQAKRAAEG